MTARWAKQQEYIAPFMEFKNPVRMELLAELELMASTGREYEAWFFAEQLLLSLTIPGRETNDRNPLRGDWEALQPYLSYLDRVAV